MPNTKLDPCPFCKCKMTVEKHRTWCWGGPNSMSWYVWGKHKEDCFIKSLFAQTNYMPNQPLWMNKKQAIQNWSWRINFSEGARSTVLRESATHVRRKGSPR